MTMRHDERLEWTAERIELLKELWADEVPPEAIAAALGGTSRSAVWSKAVRLGLKKRGDMRREKRAHALEATRVDASQHVPQQTAIKPKWTCERVATLKILWAADIAAPSIATELGGTTKSAVINKAHSLGLERRRGKRKVAAVPAPQTQTLRKPCAPESGCEECASAATAREDRSGPARTCESLELGFVAHESRCTLMDLTSKTCRWPFGDPRDKDFCFCGNPPVIGLPYCMGHARIAYAEYGRRRVTESC